MFSYFQESIRDKDDQGEHLGCSFIVPTKLHSRVVSLFLRIFYEMCQEYTNITGRRRWLQEYKKTEMECWGTW